MLIGHLKDEIGSTQYAHECGRVLEQILETFALEVDGRARFDGRRRLQTNHQRSVDAAIVVAYRTVAVRPPCIIEHAITALDDAWWTYSYSPVRDDDGSING